MDWFRAIELVANGRPFDCRGTYDSIVCHDWEKPSEAELQDAFNEYQERAAQAEVVRLALLEQFTGLPLGVQVVFKPTADALREAFARGEIETAREILNTTPVPAELEDTKNALLALMPSPPAP